MHPAPSSQNPRSAATKSAVRSKNLRLGLILGSIALAFWAGIVIKIGLLGD